MRNLELKARDRKPDRSLSVCESIEAEGYGVLEQRDTYFHARNGRLKLREETGATAHLIAYERPDQADHRESRYRIVEVAKAEELRLALTAALGIKVVVVKQRRLFLWDGVRIHLDRVDGLGSFIEFEAIAEPRSDLLGETQKIEALREAFAIDAADVIGPSYCDLMLDESR